MSKPRWAILIMLGILLVLWFVAGSPSFESCVSPQQNSDAQDALQKIISNLLIYRRCIGPFLHTNEGGITALSTVIIAIFTGILGGFTISLAKATKIAADAAADAAKAAVATDRARFYVVIKKHNISALIKWLNHYPSSETMPLNFEPKIEYTFKNYGKTPGIILEVSHGIASNVGVPDGPVYSVSGHMFSERMIAADAETETVTCDAPIMFQTIGDGLPITQGRCHVWFWGRVDYRDVFGQPQVHRFLMRYVRMGSGSAWPWGWQSYDHKHYNQST